MATKRPTHKELSGKIKLAKEALRTKDGLFTDPAKTVGELNALDLGGAEEVWPLIRELLEECDPKDYTGGKPPQKSYESAIEGSELFAFSWKSKKLSKKMYLKFVIKNGLFYYVSLHEDKPK